MPLDDFIEYQQIEALLNGRRRKLAILFAILPSVLITGLKQACMSYMVQVLVQVIVKKGLIDADYYAILRNDFWFKNW